MSSPADPSPSDEQHGFIKELDEDECYELLSTTTVGRVAFVDAEGLQLVPVNFRALERTILFRTSADSLLSQLAGGTHEIAFGVDHHEDVYRSGWNVTAHGTPTEADPAVVAELTSGTHGPRPWAPGVRDVVIALTPHRIAGRRVRAS